MPGEEANEKATTNLAFLSIKKEVHDILRCSGIISWPPDYEVLFLPLHFTFGLCMFAHAQHT